MREELMFKAYDRVRCLYNGKTGHIDRYGYRYNFFYQVVWNVLFDDGTEAEITTNSLELII